MKGNVDGELRAANLGLLMDFGLLIYDVYRQCRASSTMLLPAAAVLWSKGRKEPKGRETRVIWDTTMRRR